MSLYITWLNAIKAQATSEWLTEAQRAVYQALCSKWATAQFICLSGMPGVGKTFIGRLLAAEQEYCYVNTLADAPAGAKNVVLDGVEYTRMLHNEALLKDLPRIILLSRRPPSDPMPKIELALTERDLNQFVRNLTENHIISAFQTAPTGTDLGAILREEAIQRGAYYGS